MQVHSHPDAPAISVVFPIISEEETLAAACSEARALAGRESGGSWELVPVDDGSSDAAPRPLDELADALVRALHLSPTEGRRTAGIRFGVLF